MPPTLSLLEPHPTTHTSPHLHLPVHDAAEHAVAVLPAALQCHSGRQQQLQAVLAVAQVRRGTGPPRTPCPPPLQGTRQWSSMPAQGWSHSSLTCRLLYLQSCLPASIDHSSDSRKLSLLANRTAAVGSAPTCQLVGERPAQSPASAASTPSAVALPSELQARPNMPLSRYCTCCRPSSETRWLQGQGAGWGRGAER